MSQRLSGEIGNYLGRSWQRAEHVPMAVTFSKEVGSKSSPIFTFLQTLQNSKKWNSGSGEDLWPWKQTCDLHPEALVILLFLALAVGFYFFFFLTGMRLCFFLVAFGFGRYNL